VAEQYHDEFGLIWPVSVAPYQVHMVVLSGKDSSENIEAADKLYADLQAAGIEVLYDDRQESPGVKFNDADLIGLPIRLTVSSRALQAGGVEFKRRDLSEKEIVPLDEAADKIKDEISELQKVLDGMLKEMPFDENASIIG